MTPDEPFTTAGRALYDHLLAVHREGYIGGTTWDRIEKAIPAIEREGASMIGSLNEDYLRARIDHLETILSSIAYMRDDVVGSNSVLLQTRASARRALRDYIRRHPIPVVD